MSNNSYMRLNFDPDSKCVFATVLGPLDPPGLLSEMTALLHHSQFDRSMAIVLDVHALGLKTWTGDDIRHMSGLISQISKDICARCLAVVDHTDVGFGMLRMWQVHTNNASAGERRVFRSTAEALIWCHSIAPQGPKTASDSRTIAPAINVAKSA